MRMMYATRGVTLIELMISLVISAILVGGTYSIFISQQRTYTVQDQVVGAQQDCRAALTIMAKDIRMAGMLTGVDGFSAYGATVAITPTNSSTGPDQIRVVYAAEEFTSNGNPVTITDANPDAKQVTLSASIGTFFDTGNKKYVAFEGVKRVYQIAGVNGSTLTLTESPSDYLDNFSCRVFRVRAITYSMNNNILQRDNGEEVQTLAGAAGQPQVEDLQFAYLVKDDNTNWYDSAAEAGKISTDIRAVRINVVVRTPVQDTMDQTYSQPALEDHTTNLNGPDGFRRRTYSTVVKLRNF